MLSGEVEAWIDGTCSTAGPGAVLVLPRGVAHSLRRLTPEPVRMLTLISPPGFEQVFAPVADRGEDALLAAPERLVELAARYGIELVGDYQEHSHRRQGRSGRGSSAQ